MADEQQNEIPEFNDAQKAYFQKMLHEQGKHVVIPTELQTLEQRAAQAQQKGDYLAVKKDPELLNYFIEKYGDRGYGALHQRHLDAERDRRAAEKRVQLEEKKRRYGIR